MEYFDRRIAEEMQVGDLKEVSELERRRGHFESEYLARLPWMMRQDGADGLTPGQRATAQRSYDKWQLRTDHSFGDYVSYVQQQWREHPGNRSRFQENELVVVNQYGDVYPLTQRNTGDDPKLLRRYLREIETAPLLSVTGSWEVLRAVQDHRRDEALWPERERVWPTMPPNLPGMRPSNIPQLNRPEPWWDLAHYHVTHDRRDLNAPEDLNKPHSRRFQEQPDAARIWEAYNRNKHDVRAFVDALDEHGILLCAASKLEAEQSYRRGAFGREIDHYSPVYRDGEILAMGSDARAYRLNSRTTGSDRDDLDRFLAKLDRTQLPSIQEATQIMHERAEARQACAQLMSIVNPIKGREFEPSLAIELRRMTRYVRHVVSQGLDTIERPLRVVGRFFEFGAKAFETLFAPVLTPAQRRAGEQADHERQAAALEAEWERRNLTRERW